MIPPLMSKVNGPHEESARNTLPLRKWRNISVTLIDFWEDCKVLRSCENFHLVSDGQSGS
jgi:hypothetical protein